MILGLSGYAQSGKDTVAKVLIEKYGFTRVAFADVIRESLYVLDPIVAVGDGGRVVRLAERVDEVGWDEAKQAPEVRRLLQIFGTEIGRSLLGSDIWVVLALAKVQGEGNYVITDVRFPNEAEALRKIGGSIWRVNRPTINALNHHLSENALPVDFKFDAYIENSKDLDHLYSQVEKLLSE